MKKSGNLKKTMLKLDFLRMFKTPLFYIMTGVCLVIPVLILVMTTMVGGTTTTDQSTDAKTTIEGFTSAWQIISSSGSSSMDLTSMCNMNLVYFAIAIFVCLFIASEFKSGYVKSLFTYRAKKTDYVLSKIVVSFVAGTVMIIAFFIGAMVGGAIAGLSFSTDGFTVANIVACLLSKIGLVSIYAGVGLAASVFAKQKVWLSILVSLAFGALLFTMIPMMTPLTAGVMNVAMCIVGGALVAIGLGAVGNLILKKTDILK